MLDDTRLVVESLSYLIEQHKSCMKIESQDKAFSMLLFCTSFEEHMICCVEKAREENTAQHFF